MREKLSSRLGFVFLSAGCAIGLGNVWRFPYVAGKSGGGLFVLAYLASLVLVGVPVLVMEFAAGRAAQRSIARMHAALVPEKKAWRLHGLAGFVANVVLMSFYTVVTGWMLLYFLKMAAGRFEGLDAAARAARFDAMLASPLPMAAAAGFVTLLAAVVCSCGLQKGLERTSKAMMGSLIVLIFVLAVRSVLLPGAARGVAFYLLPDFAAVREIGLANVLVEAANQSFFSLSLGIGSMAIFGSYLGRSRTLAGEALHVAALDTFVAFAAGLIVIPACFSFGIEPAQGPGLVFVTLPNVFAALPMGRLWGSLFFVFMSFAALTTVLAVFENVVACVMDFAGVARRRACAIAAVLIGVLSLPCVLGFNVWSSFRPLGAGTCVLDLEDFIVSDLFLPLGSLAFALFCTRRYGWGWESFLREANAGDGVRIPAAWRLYCAYGVPLIILSIFMIGLMRRFSPGD
ncbi:MAG: sodium-dependent transporter [Kiritimatiellae bacterium]|nr:sodium-dependent transporter [Kiritimatiellia bacterium]